MTGQVARPAPATPSTREILQVGVARLREAGIATARPDAELLLAHVLGTARVALYVEPRRRPSPPALAAFVTLVTRRADQEPLQYLLGETEFCGLNLAVGPGVFIPRPETEVLVERALAVGPAHSARALDLCTGSGAMACALAARRSGWSVWAVEQDPEAAAWARQNVRRLGLGGRVTVVEGDLLAPLGPAGVTSGFDVLVANPPYLARETLAGLPVEVRRWEPPAALDGGADGTAVVARVLDGAPAVLVPGGVLLVEIGEDQGDWVRARLAADPRYTAVTVHRDFRGCERILEARRV